MLQSESKQLPSKVGNAEIAVHSPAQLKALPASRIPALCEQLRRVLIKQTLRGGGHLASNLGVVELTVAIHRVFDAPIDHIIFDVGHQCYVHKLLTGRADAFASLRAPGGLSGFPRREESVYDAFGTGHASTSLSAALGFAEADRLRGSDAFTVVVLGDGALTGGMIHEALNNCDPEQKLIVILNENEMSISKNEGRFARLLTRLRTSEGYFRTKSALERTLDHVPLIGAPVKEGLSRTKRGIKKVLYSNNYFEALGLNYFGPVDGHDEDAIEQLLYAAKQKGGCSIIHLKTVKGRGYAPAEQNPDKYHGLPPAGAFTSSPTFSSVFGQTLTELAESDPRICAITAAMPQGTGLSPFAQAHPDRFFDVGIAEEHAVTFAAGLSAGGMRPVVALYSTFLQRAYDQILHDVALQRLPVLFAIDRAGWNPGDGLTHHGIYDVAFLSEIPGLSLYEPLTTDRLSRHMCTVLQTEPLSLCAMRYPAGGDEPRILAHLAAKATGECAAGILDFDPSTPPATLLVTYGRLSATVLAAKAQLGEAVGTLLLEQLRPRDAAVRLLCDAARQGVRTVVFCEEGIYSGGVGMHLMAELQQALPSEYCPRMKVMAIDNEKVPSDMAYGQTPLAAMGLETEDIVRTVREFS